MRAEVGARLAHASFGCVLLQHKDARIERARVESTFNTVHHNPQAVDAFLEVVPPLTRTGRQPEDILLHSNEFARLHPGKASVNSSSLRQR